MPPETRAGRFLRLLALTPVAGWLSGCGTLPLPDEVPQPDEQAYTARYPYYLEFCALSEIQKNPGYGADIQGGVGGHSTIYLNGACRAGNGRQELMPCVDAPPGSATDGVGLSVNAHFANANWVAIPGRAFFYHGDLRAGQPLTRAVYDETKAHAERLGIYDGVRFHDRVFDDMPAGYQREAFKYEVSIGTDYAVGYGRDRYCARVPVSVSEMTRIVRYLNALNRPYQDGEAEYEWSVLNDNCIHVAHNALAEAGFWPPWPTHRFILVAALDFPVPKNEFVNIMRRANDVPIEDLSAVWDDAAARRSVLAGGPLPTRPGALASFEPLARDNALYRTDLQLIFYDEPVFGHYEDRYRRIAHDPRYTSLAANARYFAALYARIEAGRHPLSWWATHHPTMAADPDFPAFYRNYYAAVAQAAASLPDTRPLAGAPASLPHEPQLAGAPTSLPHARQLAGAAP